MSKTIKILIPNGFMNCSLSCDNRFIADTNNSTSWDTLSFPLPTPKYQWHIKTNKGDGVVVLVDRA